MIVYAQSIYVFLSYAIKHAEGMSLQAMLYTYIIK